VELCGKKGALKKLWPRAGYLGALALREVAVGGDSPPGMLSVLSYILAISDPLVQCFPKFFCIFFEEDLLGAGADGPAAGANGPAVGADGPAAGADGPAAGAAPKEKAPSWVSRGSCTQRSGGGRGLTARDAVCIIPILAISGLNVQMYFRFLSTFFLSGTAFR